MALHNYALTPGLIEKFKGAAIKAALPVERLAKIGRQVEMPQNNSKTYVARKWVVTPATPSNSGGNLFFPTDSTQVGVKRNEALVNAHASVEGVTSAPESLSKIDYSATIQEYQCLYGFTNQTEIFHEDKIPAIMKDMVGPRMALVNEMIIYGALQACTNQYFGGTGTSIATVNDKITLALIRKIVRNLQANHAGPVTKVLHSGINYKTEPVEEGYLVYVHSDLEPDIRDLAGFLEAPKYASFKPLPGEIGKVERFRFISSPDLPAILSAGASTVTYTTLQTSTATTQADVYPVIVMGENAFSQISLRGRSSSEISYLPAGQKTKSDPHGQRGYAGALWYKACLIENDNWMAMAYVATQKL